MERPGVPNIAIVITDGLSADPVATKQQVSERGSLLCDVFLCFCHFPKWSPGSGVVLDCIDS